MSAFEERLRQHRHWRDSSTDLHHCSCSTTDVSWDDWDDWVGHVVAHVTEAHAAPSPDALLVTREHLRVVFHEEYRNGDFGCRHHGNQHHASWECWGHATDIFDALSGESR